ncbi:MAG TPA: SseB family protein, partial [Streptosporangiaceae bacterium]
LTGWRPDARPVPVTARQVWQAGAGEASAVVIDIAGPVPFAVDGARLAALAEGRPAPLPHNDPDVQALAGAALAGEPLIAGFALLPGSDGSDLTIQVTLARGYGPAGARAQAAIQRAVERIVAGGGGRVQRGITVAASAPPGGGP